MTLGMTNGTTNIGMYSFAPSGGTGYQLGTSTKAFNTDVGISISGSSGTNAKAIGITTDQTKSGIILNRNSSKYLNFFVN